MARVMEVEMAGRRFIDPFELLIRREDLERILTFFMRAEERLTLAFPRAARLMEGQVEPSARQVRGSARRHYLHEALSSSAADAGLPLETKYTDPPAWSFPVIRAGAYSFTIGIVETRYRGAPRTLRSKGKYVAALCERNEITNPQYSLLDSLAPEDAVIPSGSLGGLIVAQYDGHNPERPAFLGFWVPSATLSETYYVRSFAEIIEMLRSKLSLKRRPEKRRIERKPLKRRKSKPDEGA